jgi:cell division septation protein DedD
MPSKPDPQINTQTSEVNFVLKHRIVGAGFLLFFGALVLPWLLGPPSEALKLSDGLSTEPEQISAVVERVGQHSVEQKDLVLEQEQIYISKITPLDGGADAQPNSPANGPSKNLPTNDKLVGNDKWSDKHQEADSKRSSSEKSRQGSLTPAEGSSKSADGSLTLAGSASKRIAGPAKVTSPALSIPKIDVGWVVQVGVFTDKRGAAKVVDDLRGKGFTPSTSIVDTNRGKATGTRIWLGPYGQRVEAAKAKSQLTSKTGEAGFIRAYP